MLYIIIGFYCDAVQNLKQIRLLEIEHFCWLSAVASVSALRYKHWRKSEFWRKILLSMWQPIWIFKFWSTVYQRSSKNRL